MTTPLDAPAGSRPAARVLLLDASHRLLLLEARDASSDHRWWVAPGGGLEPGESFEAAAVREVAEETGLSIELGPCVWTRRHRYLFEGRHHDQYERYFVARTFAPATRPTRPDAYVIATRWWPRAALETSTADFTPRRLPALIGDLFDARYPPHPFDCGV